MQELIDTRWNERTAIVTGAARGLGKGIADALSALGVHTLYADILPDPTLDPASDVERPANTEYLQLDLGNFDAVVDAAQSFGAKHSRIDILVNAAAHPGKMRDGVPWARADKFELEDWELMHRINLTAPFLLIRESLKFMVDNQWGRVINICSRAARTGMEGGAAYASTKGGLLSLTRLIAFEFAQYGITANAICPGRFPSALADSFPADVIEASIKKIPAQRVGKHEEVAAAVVYLASEGAAYVNGTAHDVNGGAFMG